ncbi:hypothetical protein JOS77_14465 [Chromobacterium haemolyticum]|nr:hypothetical protein JOS77_14465 [Chromobacterium haemolyticum]
MAGAVSGGPSTSKRTPSHAQLCPGRQPSPLNPNSGKDSGWPASTRPTGKAVASSAAAPS